MKSSTVMTQPKSLSLLALDNADDVGEDSDDVDLAAEDGESAETVAYRVQFEKEWIEAVMNLAELSERFLQSNLNIVPRRM